LAVPGGLIVDYVQVSLRPGDARRPKRTVTSAEKQTPSLPSPAGPVATQKRAPRREQLPAARRGVQ